MSKLTNYPTGTDGFIALMTVLILGSVSLAIALWVLIAGTDSQRWAIIQQHSANSRQVASACGEEALQQIQEDTTFAGTNNLIVDSATCTYTVTSTGTSTREINITTSGLKTTSMLKVYVTINATTISVTSWQEI